MDLGSSALLLHPVAVSEVCSRGSPEAPVGLLQLLLWEAGDSPAHQHLPGLFSFFLFPSSVSQDRLPKR